MFKRLAILGAGGHGRVVADAALSGGWQEVAFFDDRFPGLANTGEWKIAGTVADLSRLAAKFDGVIAAIGDNDIRLDLLNRISSAGGAPVSVVHPRAWVSERAEVGRGCMLSAGAIVNVGASIGAGSIINTGATVDHDCIIGEGVHIAPGAHLSGNVRVGSLSWIGVGATVRQNVTIGDNVMIGAGAVVVSDIPDGTTAIGCPARPRTVKKTC